MIDARQLAAALVPAEQVRQYLRTAGAAIEEAQVALELAAAAVKAGLKASDQEQDALLQHQRR